MERGPVTAYWGWPLAKAVFVGLLLGAGVFMLAAALFRGRRRGWARTWRGWTRQAFAVALWAAVTVAAILLGNDQSQPLLGALCVAGFVAALACGASDFQMSRLDQSDDTVLYDLRSSRGASRGDDPTQLPEITVSRPNTHVAVLRRLKIVVDGEVAAELRPNESAVLSLAPGEHVVHGAMDWTRSRKIRLDLVNGDRASVELSMPLSMMWAWFAIPNLAITITVTPAAS